MSSEAPTTDTGSPARAYQEYYGPAIFEPLTTHTLRYADPRPGEHVLDLACGTGIVTRRLVEAVGPTGWVDGLDVNPVMLEEARARTGPDVRARYLEGDAASADLPAASYDVVVCQQGLQFFGDRGSGARLMRRVLRESGRAVVVTWRGLDRHPLYRALADAEVPHLATMGVEVSRVDVEAPFSLGDADELRGLLRRAGFSEVTLDEVSIEARFPEADDFVRRMEYAYAAVIPRFVEDASAFEAYLDGIADDAREVVDAHRQGDFVVTPMHAIVAVATG